MYLVKRNKVFHIFYFDENGVQKSKSTKCTSKVDANKFAHKFFNAGKSIEPEIFDLTFEQYRDFYSKYASTRFTPNYQNFVSYAFSQFGRIIPNTKLIKDIRTSDVELFITLKLTEAKEQLVNGYLRTLQGAFQRAVELGYLNANIFQKIKKLKFAENQPVFLSNEELKKIIDSENDEQLKLIYNFAFNTGMRMAEIRFLKWESIDFENSMITVQNHHEFTTKSKKARTIPIQIKIKQQLQELYSKGIKGEYVFMKNGSIMKKDFLSSRFGRAIKLAELDKKYHFHSLRHSFASLLIQKGVSIYTVSKLLGHADIKTTMIYSHLRTEDLRNAINVLNN